MAEMFFLGDTKGRGIYFIITSFIFLAYILHPVVEAAYHRIRAYRAWRTIEDKRGRVDVTEYPLVSELLDGWKKWNTARIVALILLVFAGASWGLDLTLRLANIDSGPVDMFNHPPPVYLSDDLEKAWEVLVMDSSSKQREPQHGRLKNLESTSDTVGGNILSTGKARSVYRVERYGKRRLKGVTIMAEWSNSVDHTTNSLYYGLYHGQRHDNATLQDLVCRAGGEENKELRIISDGEDGRDAMRWGTVTECEAGPLKDGENLEEDHDTLPEPPPTIILRGDASGTYLIAEEKSDYPDFFYSVWTIVDDSDTVVSTAPFNDSGGVRIKLSFFVGSSFRMVEAIITGIARGVLTGGGCVDQMLEFSEGEHTYGEKKRARPFGEHPGNNSVVRHLDDIDTIEKGIEVDAIGIVCLILLGIVSAVGIGWSISLRSKVGMDVFNRDELVVALAQRGQVRTEDSPSAVRMFVSKVNEDIRVDICPIDDNEKLFHRWLRRPEDDPCQKGSAVADTTAGSKANPVPPRIKGGSLEVIRLGHGRVDFAREFPDSPLHTSPLPSPQQSPSVPSSAKPSSPTSPAMPSSTDRAAHVSPVRDHEFNLPAAIGARWRTRYAPSNFNRILSIPRHPWRLVRQNSESSASSRVEEDADASQAV